MQDMKKENYGKRPLAHPLVLFVLTLICYGVSAGVGFYCVTTYSAMETHSDEFLVRSSTALEADGYDCDMIAPIGANTKLDVCKPDSTSDEYCPSPSYTVFPVGAKTTEFDPMEIDMFWHQTMFDKVASCHDLFESDAFWATCVTYEEPGQVYGTTGIYCDGWSTFDGAQLHIWTHNPKGLLNEQGVGLTSSDVKTLVAAMRARPEFMSRLKNYGCYVWPFPPYGCRRRTTEKTFTWLGVLSLSIANTELAYGILCLGCAGLLTCSLKKMAKAALEGEDAIEKL